jgi:putative colanic acid biosysnthesis UDP-glucose lipid carrier transferase
VRTNVGIKWVPDMSVFHLISHSVSHLQGQPVFSLTDSPLSSGQSTLKWLEDVVLGTCLSILALPALLAIAIAVKMSSPGPIFYVQLRLGLQNQPVRIWKFRTMYVAPEGDVARQATEDDPRVTPVGRFLRRWSLDELPQLLQVPLGYLSLVGPRPHPIWLNDRYSSMLLGYMQRHRVKPGLTGWAQVNGLRGETDTPDKMEARLHCDLYYINNWSLLLDLKIILRTVAVVLRGTNAT